ncbi:FAD synthetase family protein [Virgibacillus alimentarius]|uniref:FAD synthase n=1 Tax=Virgibacillus alimentarius TaxID=698769 RepID=A0ABS4SAR3_9BACI|nr:MULTISPECIES: FAD synthetase family protein [Virgibacillus]MBP2258597.1 riboflavin kinase/FMN adenylyltransferase [Virgibacillus alimentarius]HLR66705.1 FAD synthetase family protein [Virgibacillus sp.]
MNVFQENELTLEASIVSIGAFDGMHRGHQALITKAAERARRLNIPSVVYTFNPPPRAHFQNHIMLTSVEEKIKIIKELGIDYIIVANFNDSYAARSVYAFIDELEDIGTQEIWVGKDFHFGKGKSGNVHLLSEYFNTCTLPFVTCDKGETISSTRIRNLIHKNDWFQAYHLLGRNKLEKIK